MVVKIIDLAGQEQNMEWLKAKYGNVQVWPIENPEPDAEYYKVVELREKVGPSVIVIKLIDEDGNPISDRASAQGWRDGAWLPDDMDPRNGLPPGYPNRGGADFHNAEGDKGWGWGQGEYYDPSKTEGAHYYWMCNMNSEVVTGIGMLPLTEHLHLDITFQRVTKYDPPTNGDGGDVAEAIKYAGDQVGNGLQAIAESNTLKQAQWEAMMGKLDDILDELGQINN